MRYTDSCKDSIFYRNGKWFVKKGCSTSYYWNPQMVSDLRRFYPTNTNKEVAEILGTSISSVLRMAKKMRLSKNPTWVRSVRHSNLNAGRLLGGFKKGNDVGRKYWFKKYTNHEN